ncbi:MAG: ABC transporter permease [Planctomycetes bacterium]|nr:ABC transporter permease [Planctomycetota bacterium]
MAQIDPSREYSPLRELIFTRLREFFREPEAIFWVYIFPVFLAVGLGVAFRSQPQQVIKVGAASGEGAERLVEIFRDQAGFQLQILPAEECRKDLARGRLDVMVEAKGKEYRYVFDPTRLENAYCRDRVNRAIQRAAGAADPVPVEDEHLSEPGTRYIDFLFPGLIGMNLMGGGLYGMGYVIVDMRVRKLLKRFLATPMRRSDFFIAMLSSRLLFLIPEMLFLLAVACLGFGVPVRGSMLAVGSIALVSALSFAGLGLLVATRARKLETISGLMNLVMLPMWLLGGIFFTTGRFPEAMQPLIQALPITATNNALRAVMLEGATLASQLHELGIMLGWGLVSYLLSFRLFRWI